MAQELIPPSLRMQEQSTRKEDKYATEPVPDSSSKPRTSELIKPRLLQSNKKQLTPQVQSSHKKPPSLSHPSALLQPPQYGYSSTTTHAHEEVVYPHLKNAKERLLSATEQAENLHPNPIIQPKTSEKKQRQTIPKAQKVEEMLEARKKQKMEAGPTRKAYYESIEDRIKRQSNSQSCSGTPKIAPRNLTPQGNTNAISKTASQSDKRPPKKMDMQRRIIDLMLDSGLSSGTPSRPTMQPRATFGTCPVTSDKKGLTKPAAQQAQRNRPMNLPPRQLRPTSNVLPNTEAFSSTIPKPSQQLTTRAIDKGLQSQLNVAIRNEIWLQQRNDKVVTQVNRRQESETVGCTFEPHFETKDHQYLYSSGLNACQSTYKALSPTKLTSKDMNVIMHSNSYSQINEVKSRSRSRDKSMSNGQNADMVSDNPKTTSLAGYRELFKQFNQQMETYK